MNRKQKTILVIALVLAAHPRAHTQTRSQYNPNNEDYAIYSVLLEEIYKNSQAIIITNRTLEVNLEPATGLRFVQENCPKLSQEALENFNKNNGYSYSLGQLFQFKPGYVLIGSETLEEIFGQGSWELFYQKYPHSGGHIMFSRVGYNKELSEALVSYFHSCGRLCSSYGYVRLLKKSGVWVIKDEIWMGGS
jgi:hypothetical protein